MRLCSLVASSFLCFLAPKSQFSFRTRHQERTVPPTLLPTPLSVGRLHSPRRRGLHSSVQEPTNTTASELVLKVPLKSSQSPNDDQYVALKEHHESTDLKLGEEPSRNAKSWKSIFDGMPSQSVLLLNMVAVLWGTQHAVIKMILQDSDASSFTLLRFGLAALLASPFTPGLAQLFNNDREEEGEDASTVASSASVATTWRWGAEMGFWMFLGFSFQAIGLGFTTAQRSGFLLYLNVKFVPFLARILFGREISNATWASAVAAFTGTALLAYGGSNGASGLALNVGDLWSIAAAVASAMFILRLEQASSQVPNAAQLNSACLWVVTLLAGVWTVGQADGGTLASTWQDVSSIISQHPWQVVYLSGVTTAFANLIQTKAQRDVSAERASVIYAMDPVYGAGFSYVLLGETLGGIPGWIGAGIITLAAATNAFLDLSDKDHDHQVSAELQPEEEEEVQR